MIMTASKHIARRQIGFVGTHTHTMTHISIHTHSITHMRISLDRTEHIQLVLVPTIVCVCVCLWAYNQQCRRQQSASHDKQDKQTNSIISIISLVEQEEFARWALNQLEYVSTVFVWPAWWARSTSMYKTLLHTGGCFGAPTHTHTHKHTENTHHYPSLYQLTVQPVHAIHACIKDSDWLANKISNYFRIQDNPLTHSIQ